jgi:hypothetical protein
MKNIVNLHTLTQSAMEELQHAYLECAQKPVEGHILSAIVSVRMVHDIITGPEFSCADIDPEEFCCAV